MNSHADTENLDGIGNFLGSFNDQNWTWKRETFEVIVLNLLSQNLASQGTTDTGFINEFY